MTEELLLTAGFEPCPTPPPGWCQRFGTIYTSLLPRGRAYVRCLTGQAGLVEGFVGDCAQPLAYCRGLIRTPEQLLLLLA
ncbi:hypothetical protein Q5H93_13300 [Hymenobacter sp. ASUV-10]|uniref:Uncharacterized protein n=1 Tax=Hymenobacter aranciens TaxID=3063996 RepID=A0ABT9BBS3_9BACT|nr:hypothetical protein [Hymenobacter sp. ASUV-10]MDO7875715.1 hypothetical protein [Hymenobacter sp. ASUV-10]